MSWRLLLADYPHAVLKDELNVVILAMLESGGLLSEDEIARDVEIAPSLLVKTLVSLHGDRLIEYSRQRIRVSERGKALLDRLTLDVDILDGLVSNFDLQPPLRQRLKSEIAQYRARSFDQYLGSVSAMHSWSALCRDASIRTHLPPESEASGRLAIWVRDLSDWASAETLALDVILQTRSALSTASSDTLTARLALAWIEASEAIKSEADPWTAVRSQPDGSTGLFCLHQASRTRLEKTFFLDEWSPIGGRWYNYLKSFRHLHDALKCVPAYASQHWTVLPVALPVPAKLRNNDAEGVLRRQLSDLLVNLMTAVSLSELTQTTRLDENNLRILLEQIRDKCQMLVAGSMLSSKRDANSPRD